MIGLLKGTIFSGNKNPVIVMVNGVGYAVNVPLGLLSKMKANDHIILHVHTHVRDDAIELFGFSSSEELDMFHLLLDVSGIGPKTALSVIDKGVQSISHAIVESDVDFFTTVPRLGKKNAQKIIIDLKSKLGSVSDLDLKENEPGETRDVIDALMAMGFNKKEIVDTLKKLPPGVMTVEQKIRRVLQYIGK